MSRIPKFRAWDKVNKVMYKQEDLESIIFETKVICIYTADGYKQRRLSDFELIEYTGIKDSNSVEIFEGDVIKITYNTAFSEHPVYLGHVEYLEEEEYPAFDLRPWIDCEMNALSWLKSESDESVIKYEVIGNIHNDSESLEVQHEQS